MLDLEALERLTDIGIFDDEWRASLQPKLPALIAELRTSRKVIAELREAADSVRVFAYGVVTANEGTVPPDQTIYLKGMLSRLDTALAELSSVNVGEKDWPHDTTPNRGR